jgi:hypothetical protein
MYDGLVILNVAMQATTKSAIENKVLRGTFVSMKAGAT